MERGPQVGYTRGHSANLEAPLAVSHPCERPCGGARPCGGGEQANLPRQPELFKWQITATKHKN